MAFSFTSSCLPACSPCPSLDLSPTTWEASTFVSVLHPYYPWGVVYGPPQPHLPHLHLAREPLFDLQIHSFNSPGYLHPIVSHVLQMHINDHTIIVPLAYFCYRVPILIKRQGHLLPTLVIRKLLPPSHPHYILLVINYIAQLPK